MQRFSIGASAVTLTLALVATVCPAGEEKTPRRPAVRYDMPVDAEVTLGICDSPGHMLRWLARSDFRRAGPQAEPWDGLDQWGHPLPPAVYTVKAAYHPPLTTEYQYSLGNPGMPPWPTLDGKGDWLSDEASPQAAVSDGQWVFLAAPGSEKGFSIIAVDGQGRRQWGAQEEFYPRAVSLAVEGEYLYALYSGPELTDTSRRYRGQNAVGRAILLCLDKRTGQAAKFTRENARLTVATWPYKEQAVGLWELRTKKAFSPDRYGGEPRYFCNDLGEPTNALGIAALGGRLYVSLFEENKLLVLDGDTGRPVDEIPLARPVGLHAAADRSLLAVSGTLVVKVDPATRRATPLVTRGLVAPHSVTTDRAGRIYVSDWGASFQVKVFSPRGELLRAIGKEGGRPWVGVWDPTGMLVPRGIAVTDDGQLWVAEDDSLPKRISVWDTATGRFLREYLGPASYGGGSVFWVDPKDPTIVCTMGVRFKLDLQRKQARPLATVFRRMSRDQPFVPNAHGWLTEGMRVIYRAGNEYLLVNGYHMAIMLVRRGDVYVPVAAAGGNSRLATDDGTGRTLWDSDVGYHLFRNYYPECFRGHAGDNFSWVDRNGDGLVQPDEIQWVKTLSHGEAFMAGRQPEWLTPWGAGLAPDGTVFFTGFCRDRQVTFRLDVQGWTPGGVPIYDIASARQIILDERANSVLGLYVNSERKLFVTHCYERREHDTQAPDPTMLACYDRGGRLQWSVAPPQQSGGRVVSPAGGDDKAFHAENVAGDFTLPGLGNVLCTWLWHGNYRPYFITSDGLFLGTVLEPGKLGPAAAWDESYKYFFQTPDGAPHIVNGANDAQHVLAIHGLDQGGRLSVALPWTEQDAHDAAALRALPVKREPPSPILHVAWLDPAPKIDGDLSDWDMRAGVRLTGSGKRWANVALGRDAERLYLAYAVEDDTPLLNRGQNWQTLFITGDCVDLMLATDPQADRHRRAPAAGDLRLLLGVFGNEPIAVRYRPVVPGSKQPVQLMAARIDEIVRLRSAQVAVRRGDHAYTIEAAVTLQDLGINPKTTTALAGDVGVIYSDETGTNRSQRVYYYNRQTRITADLTTEAALQPDQWGVVEMPLGKNRLRNGGFETPLAAAPQLGWSVQNAQNGAVASLTADVAHSGRQSLLLQQTAPVRFPPEAYTAPNFEDFRRKANGGKGSGHVAVVERVPVQAGKQYTLRFHCRSEDFHQEVKTPGKDRGYAGFSCWVYWVGVKKPAPAAVWALNEQSDSFPWKTLVNARANYWGLPQPYTAPEGATAAVVSLQLTTLVDGHLPRVHIDDVEFVELGP